MSETTPTVAPTIPAATTTEGAVQPAATPTVTEAQPKTAADFLARVKMRANGNASVAPSPAAEPSVAAPDPAVSVDATGRVHGSDGKFVAKPAGDEPAASAPAPGATTETAGAEPAVPEVVKLALPEGHPLRDRGLAELPFAVPKEHEEVVRSLLNEPVRKQQVAEAFARAREAESRALQAQAEAEFWRTNSGEFLTPEFYAQFADIKQTYGEAAAETFKAGQMEAARAKLETRRAEVNREMTVQQIQHTASAFRAAAIQDAANRYPGWTQPELERAFQVYGAWLHATNKAEPSAQDWYTIADPLYAGSTAGQGRRADEARRIEAQASQRAQQEAAERERQQLDAAAANRQRNPLSSVPNVQTGLSVPGGDNRPKSAREFIERTKAAARGLA